MSRIDEHVRTRTAKHKETAFDHAVLGIYCDEEDNEEICEICNSFSSRIKKCTIFINEKYEEYIKETDNLVIKSHDIEIDFRICAACLYEHHYGEE